MSQQLRRDLLLEEIETLVRQVRRIEQQLNRQAKTILEHLSFTVNGMRRVAGFSLMTVLRRITIHSVPSVAIYCFSAVELTMRRILFIAAGIIGTLIAVISFLFVANYA